VCQGKNFVKRSTSDVECCVARTEIIVIIIRIIRIVRIVIIIQFLIWLEYRSEVHNRSVSELRDVCPFRPCVRLSVTLWGIVVLYQNEQSYQVLNVGGALFIDRPGCVWYGHVDTNAVNAHIHIVHTYSVSYARFSIIRYMLC